MTTSRTGGKGPELEEALKAYFWRAGYFVVRGVPYRVEDDEVTDIDLWLYERPAALTRRRLIVDAKNKQRPKSSERIIWSKGLRDALGVDGVIVATTDQRDSARRLARSVGVTLLDGDAVSKLLQSEKLQQVTQLYSSELDASVKKIDEGRRSSEWRQNLLEARASLLTGFGTQSTNQNLRASGFFAEQAILAQPKSDQAQIALRLFYLTSALAAVSLDYSLSDHAFRSQEDKKRLLINGIRFGHSEAHQAFLTVRAAIGLVRQYADNGKAVAIQIERGFDADAHRIPAEMISDHVAKISGTDALFNIARECERASFEIGLPSFDEMTIEAKSLLGVFLDFNGVSREKVASAWPKGAALSSKPVAATEPPAESEPGPLFQDKKAEGDQA
jgi:hypothetical protein